MISAFVNSPEKQDELQEAIEKTKDIKLYKRLLIIQLSSKGKSVKELSDEFSLCKHTIRAYIHKYNQGGIQAVVPHYAKGNHTKFTLSKEEWEELLRQSPSQFEKLDTPARNWTQKLLVKYFKEYHGIEVTQSGVCKCLQKMKIKWNRGKLKVTSSDPLYTIKRARIEELKEKAVAGNLSSDDAKEAGNKKKERD
jgi:transposase